MIIQSLLDTDLYKFTMMQWSCITFRRAGRVPVQVPQPTVDLTPQSTRSATRSAR